MGASDLTVAYLVDNSAWSRFSSAAVPEPRRIEIARAVDGREVWTSPIFELEAGFSAHDAERHALMMRDFARLPHAPIDREAGRRAIALQGQLAQSGHHRLPPPDLLTMAVAERHGLTVLHYDKDFDVIRERTDCLAETEWLVPRGSL